MTTSDRILVTGASGFVGQALVRHLIHLGQVPIATTRRKATPPLGAQPFVVGELGADTDWRLALRGCTAVVHAAARVHVMKDSSIDPLGEFRKANVAGTIRLATQAAQSGVRRFVFISSIKVNGEITSEGSPFTSSDIPQPADPYAVSKLEAEQAVLTVAKNTGMEVVIIRPVLVYGPGVKANFHWMMRWLHSGLPIPLGGVKNVRSFVALENLVDLVSVSLHHPAAANRIFLVSDGEDLSTPELLTRLGRSLGKPARLFSVPEQMVAIAASLVNKREIVPRLYGSLHVDIRDTHTLLGWYPVVGVDQALLQTAQAFLRRGEK